MIRACFRMDGGRPCGLSLQGHAYAGPYGHDLVCAGVSALAIATANSFVRLGLPFEVGLGAEDDGSLSITQTGPLDATQALQAQVLWDTLYHALRDMAATYGTRYLSIQTIRLKEVGICSR